MNIEFQGFQENVAFNLSVTRSIPASNGQIMNTKLPTFGREHIQRKPKKKLVKKMTEIYHSHETSGPL